MAVLSARVKHFVRQPFVSPVLGLTAPLVRFIVRSTPNGKFKRVFWRFIGNPVSYCSWRFTTRTAHEIVFQGNIFDFIYRYIYFFGSWEPNLSTWITQRLSHGDTFVDVGANIGYYALLASRFVGASGRVVAIEASPGIFRQLEHNLSLNDAGNVRAINVAVSDRDGEVSLYLGPQSHSGLTSIISQTGLSFSGSIRARPLRTILSEDEFRGARLFKIDVEGGEWLVLSGLAAYLAQTRPDAEFVVEISPSRLALLQRKPDDLLDIFKRAGFNAYRIQNDYRPSTYLDKAPYQAPQRLAEPITYDADIIFSRLDRVQI